MDCSRRQLFEQLDRPALRTLPDKSFRIPKWKLSVGVKTVECFFHGKRVACHPRSHARGRYTTTAEHRPAAHRQYAEWTPSRVIRWASTVGEWTAGVVEHVLMTKRHPEQGYRSALGIIRLDKRYGKERLERACQRALEIRSPSYKTIESMLKTGMDSQPSLYPDRVQTAASDHENVRGSHYYH